MPSTSCRDCFGVSGSFNALGDDNPIKTNDDDLKVDDLKAAFKQARIDLGFGESCKQITAGK